MSLRAENASVDLGGREELSSFTFGVKGGELVGVVGANGAGKSTALKLLCGLHTPRTGSVTLDGEPLANLERAEIGRRIAYLPQDRTVHWGLTSERIVALGRLPHRSFSAAESARDGEAVASAMQRMDVAALKDRSISELSGGERARVLMARALAQEARYLIADEPTAGLDPAHALALFSELARLAADGHGVIVALHDLSLAARFATRLVLMKHGRCLADGPPAAVLSSSNLEAAFSIDAIVAEIDGIPVVLPRSETRN